MKLLKASKVPPREKGTPMTTAYLARFLQEKIVYLLYAAMALRIVETLFPQFTLIDFSIGILLYIFFAVELFLLSPAGMAMMCLLVIVLFCLLPYVFMTLMAILAVSVLLLVVGAIISFALSGVLIAVTNGVIMSVQVISVTAPMMIAAGALGVSSAVTAGVGYGTQSAIETASRNASRWRGRFLRNFLGNILIFLLIAWPGLSYADANAGIVACKPATILSQDHIIRLNIAGHQEYVKRFVDDSLIHDGKWPFENRFYSKYINNGTNNISQGSNNLIAGNEEHLATVLNNILYICDTSGDSHSVAACHVRPTDTLVLMDDEAYIFGNNKVLLCGNLGTYTWNHTKWTRDFKNKTTDEQYEHIYDILERQNTDKLTKFSCDEVAVVAYAQRTGMLVDYDEQTHEALFAQRNKDDSVTLYLQSETGSRQEQTTFTPSWSEESLPYTMTNDGGLLYLKDHEVRYLYPTKGGGWGEIVTFAHPEENGKVDRFIALLYADLGEEGIYSAYLDENDELWVDTRPAGGSTIERGPWKIDRTKVSGFAGNYLYSVQYDDDLISKLTYINDLKATTEEDHWEFIEIWAENWHYQRVRMDKSVLVK